MEIIKDWRLHALAIVVIIVSELIGKQVFLTVLVFPMLYAMIFGTIVSIPKLKIMTEKSMKNASGIMIVSLMLLIAKLGVSIGPNLTHIFNAKGALLFQEVGHFIGTILLGLPLAIMLGMGREAVGATYSVAREPNIAIIANKYGLDSPEGRGVMAMYICGTLYGAIWMGIMASIIAKMDILHPFALAMGAGVGSGSMMAASVMPIIELYPQYESEITAYAGSANLMSGILGIYIYIFFSLPFASKMYDLLSRILRKKTVVETEETQAKIEIEGDAQ